MAMKNIKVGFKGKSLIVKARELSPIEMLTGLMFRGRNCNNLLFDFKGEGRFAIHSWFVFFPFLAVWLDAGNKVRKLIEVPLNRENTDVISLFSDGERSK